MGTSEFSSFFQRMKAACSNPFFYIIPLQEPAQKAAIYLLKLVALIFIVQGPLLFNTGWQVSGTIAENLKTQLPQITFHNGQLNVDAAVPLEINLYADYSLLIDPYGEKTRRQLSHRVLMVASNNAIYLRSGQEFNSFYTNFYEEDEQAQEIVINSEMLSHWLPRMRVFFAITLLLSLLFSLIVMTILRLVLLGAAGLIARSRADDSLTMRQILKLTAYVLTPLLLAETIFSLIGLAFPHMQFIFLVLTTLWLFFIIHSLDQQPPPGSTLDTEA